MAEELEIRMEMTPNPNMLKYALNRMILLTSAEYFRNKEEAEEFSPLALKLFDIGVQSVMIGSNFITIGIEDNDNLRDLNRDVINTIRDHINSGEEICRTRDDFDKTTEDPISQTIREILDAEIRPAVAQVQDNPNGRRRWHLVAATTFYPSAAESKPSRRCAI